MKKLRLPTILIIIYLSTNLISLALTRQCEVLGNGHGKWIECNLYL